MAGEDVPRFLNTDFRCVCFPTADGVPAVSTFLPALHSFSSTMLYEPPRGESRDCLDWVSTKLTLYAPPPPDVFLLDVIGKVITSNYNNSNLDQGYRI